MSTVIVEAKAVAGAQAESEVIAGANCPTKGDGTKEEKGRREKVDDKGKRMMWKVEVEANTQRYRDD